MKDEQAKLCRDLACSVPKCRIAPVVAAHVVHTRGAGGQDCDIVPLCWRHEREWHDIGKWTFNEKYDVDLQAIAARLAEGMKP